MWRVFWVAAFVVGITAVAVAAMSSTPDGALGADVSASVARVAVFVLGGMLVVTAIVGNVALTAIKPRVHLTEGL